MTGESAGPVAPRRDVAAMTRATFWLALAALSFVGLATCVRMLSDTMNTLEVAFLRSLVAMLFFLPVLAGPRGRQSLKTSRFRLMSVRAILNYLAMLGYFYAIAFIPIADAIAIQFVIPLFALVCAALFLGETVGSRRWGATAVGFVGALIVVRPGIIEVGVPTLSVLVSAMLYAVTWTLLKVLTRTESSTVIVFQMNLVMVIVAAIPAALVWVTPTWADLPVILLLGFCGSAAHFCQARGFSAVDASVAAPFDFLRLPMAAVVGFVLFGELSDVWTWVGAVIIFAATTYISHRETVLERQRRAAAVSVGTGPEPPKGG